VTALLDGTLALGVLTQLYSRARRTARRVDGAAWEPLRDQLQAMILSVTGDREALLALGRSEVPGYVYRARDLWPTLAEVQKGAAPSRSIVAAVTLAESLLGELLDELREKRRTQAVLAAAKASPPAGASALDVHPDGSVTVREVGSERLGERAAPPLKQCSGAPASGEAGGPLLPTTRGRCERCSAVTLDIVSVNDGPWLCFPCAGMKPEHVRWPSCHDEPRGGADGR
jgi:hypothetical protein